MKALSKSYGQKLKLIHINKFLCENTDEQHSVTITDIIEHLSHLGISTERKSLYDDIECLRVFGTDIETVKQANRVGYYVASRPFQLSELKLLVDAVEGSKFITQKKSDLLIKKLGTLCSNHEANALSRQTLMTNRIKSMNESIYYNVDKLHNAISSDRSITFQYFDYNLDKERILRHDGKLYRVSPFSLHWDDENYYLIAYDHEKNDIRHYRVDKMMNISITKNAREGKDVFKKADIARYSERVFSMFGGNTSNVCLEFDNSLCGTVIDRFGRDIVFCKSDTEGKFQVRCKVDVSMQFFGWLCGFGDKVKIVSPDNLSEQFRQFVESILEKY